MKLLDKIKALAETARAFNPMAQAASLASDSFSESVGSVGEAVANKDIKKLAGAAYDTLTPLPVQLALNSNEAQAAFGGAGRQDLLISHGTSVDSLLRRIFKSRAVRGGREAGFKEAPQLLDPSFAIARGSPFNNNFYAGAAVLPKPSAVDPATNLLAKLYNRDAYVYRSKDDKFLTDWHARQRAADPRLTEAGVFQEPYNTLKHSQDSTLAHFLQVRASPEFKSLAEYEASPYGAALLDKQANMSERAIGNLRQRITALTKKHLSVESRRQFQSDKDVRTIINDYARYADEYAPEWATDSKFMELLRRTPSSYAELKLRKPFTISPETTQAVVTDSASARDIATLRNHFKVPIINMPAVDTSPEATDMLLTLIRQLQE